jgi:hypothetical protein
MEQAPNPLFAAAGIDDPEHEYMILCVNPLVVVADLKKVGERPLPTRWVDLLDPIWRRDTTLRFSVMPCCCPFTRSTVATA